MYCHQCGTEIGGQALYCSGCGRAAAEPAAAGRQQRNMDTHVQILGWLLVASAVLTAMFGFALLITPRVLQALPIALPPDVPFDIVQFVSAVSGILGTTILIVSAGTAAAGVGLLQYQSWGRGLALFMCAVMLLKIPFGTAIGIYGFWVLLSERGREHFERRSAIAEGRV